MCKIYCANCKKDVDTELVHGSEVYPHRKDLREVPFWECPSCNGKVGCHHKSMQPSRPLGIIPSPEIAEVRGRIHAVLDPLYRQKFTSRKDLYKRMAAKLGIKEYHTAQIRTLEEAQKVLDVADEVRREVYAETREEERARKAEEVWEMVRYREPVDREAQIREHHFEEARLSEIGV